MKAEEKLNHLFKTLRDEPLTTGISDVVVWVNTPNPVSSFKIVKSVSTIKKIVIMSSLISSAIVGSFLLFFPEKPANEPIRKNALPPVQAEKLQPIPIEKPKTRTALPSRKSSEQASLPALIHPSVKELVAEEPEATTPATLNPAAPVTMAPAETSASSSGFWKAENHSLNVDTSFRGVRKIVYRASYNDKIVLRGSRRKDVGLHFHYQYKVKGLFKWTNEQLPELSYELKDSVLTVRRKYEPGNTVGLAVFISRTDLMSFEVPDDIPLDIETKYGDIAVQSTQGNPVKLNTAYGDVETRNTSGSIDIKTSYGDIRLVDAQGKIEARTAYGDISGSKILAAQQCNLQTSMGDIKVQMLNPMQDFSLDAKTAMGDVKIDRDDMAIKSENHIKIGNGPVNLRLSSSFGDVIIR
jgi:hypothetical protein